MSDLSWRPVTVTLSELQPWARNPRRLSKKQAARLLQSWDDLGQFQTIAIGPGGEVYDGHQRLSVLKAAHGNDYTVQALQASRALTEAEREALTILAQTAAGSWDWDALAGWDTALLQSLGLDADLLAGLNDDAANLREMLNSEKPAPVDAEPQIDRAEELREKWGVETGQLWQLGAHRLICGDCTDAAVVARVMGGEKARAIFTDPPYGIGKDIENDNLKRGALVDFYRAFTDVMLGYLIENGYFYVWGYFDTLSDYWQEVIKPRGDCNFRNFIIWRKRNIQGRNAEDFRQFPEEYEAALLCIYGQPFQNGPWSTSPNSEYYPEIFEPVRAYLDGERAKMGWDIQTCKKIAGHSDLSRDHWFGKSQWTIPTREVYEKFQAAARGDAFRREYDDLRREYDDLRGYFDNKHGFTDVWEFQAETRDARHPTVKPVELCERGILSVSQDGETVLDVFSGSGTTLIACERLGRRCRAVEISPAYVAVTLQRWADLTGKTPVLLERQGS